MNVFLLPLGVGLLLLATAAVGRLAQDRRRAAGEAQAGLDLLRMLRWKEFAHFVAQSFESRGWSVTTSQRAPGEEGADLVLARGDDRLLLQVKHGGSYQVGAGAVRSLAAMLPRQHAQAGAIVTSGAFDAEAIAAAKGLPVTLLAGAELWAALRGLLPAALVAEADARASALQRRLRSRLGVLAIAGAGISLLGAGLWTLERLERDAEPAPTPTAQPAPPAPAPAPAPTPAAETAVATQAAGTTAQAPAADGTPAAPTEMEPSPERLAQQRDLAAAEALLVAGVATASWSSASTLVVGLRAPMDEQQRASALREVCARITTREALLFTRLQVEMLGETGTPTPTRWFPCR